MSNFKKILLLVVILNILIIIDAAGYMLIEGANFTDSLYMTVITITTVGYKEVFELSSSGKLFTIWVIISGLGTFFLMAGRIAESAFEGNLRRILGRRKMKNLLQLKDHIIVAGFGVMGEQVCRELARAKLKFVVIENNKERFANAEERGYEVINGNATEEEILKQSGVQKARTFISLLSSDADNVFTVLTAREMNPPAYIITRAMDAANQNKLYKIGANRVIAPYELSSRRIVNMVLRPNVVDFIDVMVFGPNMALSIEEITVHEGSPFACKEIKDSGLRQDYNIIIIAVKRKDEMFFNPAPDHRILPGDILILVGEREKLLNIN
ncbi:MAG TPA: potassium channel protein [Candidatus Deferrimicrobium sp.]|nr:potassium channel protein [Candidatus Kapabacteria bacterium]HLP60466.1 potassium channel protein [Candidatus Deferrimicrobium sp.]